MTNCIFTYRCLYRFAWKTFWVDCLWLICGSWWSQTRNRICRHSDLGSNLNNDKFWTPLFLRQFFRTLFRKRGKLPWTCRSPTVPRKTVLRFYLNPNTRNIWSVFAFLPWNRWNSTESSETLSRAVDSG